MAPSHRRTHQSSSSASASGSDSEPYSPDEEEQVDIPGHTGLSLILPRFVKHPSSWFHQHPAQPYDQHTTPSAPMASVQRDTSEDELYTSWFRVAATTETAFPVESKTGPAPFVDLDGSPIFVGSALMERSVHPCRIGPGLKGWGSYVSAPLNGKEFFHRGRYDLLPYSELQDMEWVPTSQGRIPQGRRPVLGGHEENDDKLYHAAAYIDLDSGTNAKVRRVKMPGMTGERLGDARISFGGREYRISQNYDLLCWKR